MSWNLERSPWSKKWFATQSASGDEAGEEKAHPRLSLSLSDVPFLAADLPVLKKKIFLLLMPQFIHQKRTLIQTH